MLVYFAMSSEQSIKIGTRGSPLAITQANYVRELLLAEQSNVLEKQQIRICSLTTMGDRFTDRPLSTIGGKGLFTKEIDQALIDKELDCAVHCVKDMPTQIPEGIVVAAVLKREDPRDAFISKLNIKLCEVPDGTIIGTTSLRRKAQLLAHYPKLQVVGLRGNVQTRIDKINSGTADATLLAISGLKRLNMEKAATEILSTEIMLPAVGQGALLIACRTEDITTQALLAKLHHQESSYQIEAERAMLKELDGSCATPIAGLATISEERLSLRGLVAQPDGRKLWEKTKNGVIADARIIGQDLGQELRAVVGENFFKNLNI